MKSIFNSEMFRKSMAERRIIKKSLNLRDAAREIGTSSATLSRIERGRLPDIETFFKCCKWLKTSANKFNNTNE
jgi:transcriptional regulator with XRE-family HTH domain